MAERDREFAEPPVKSGLTNNYSSAAADIKNYYKFAILEPLNSKDIEILVNRLKTGDQGAFAEMYDRYSGAINGVITRIVRDTEASQDVLQDTFVKVWRNIQSYDSSKGSFFTWMLNIARNTSIDALRKLKKEGKTEIQNWDAAVGVVGAAQQNINSIGLRKLVEKLPDEQRIMIEYIYFQGYTQQEVADELNMPLGTVKTRTRLAMRELRKAFTLLVLWM